MNDIAILHWPPHLHPHYRKAEVMVYGMTQAEEAEFLNPAKVISRGAKDFHPVGRALARAYKVRISIAFNMQPSPIIVRIAGVQPHSSLSAHQCQRTL